MVYTDQEKVFTVGNYYYFLMELEVGLCLAKTAIDF